MEKHCCLLSRDVEIFYNIDAQHELKKGFFFFVTDAAEK
jgi:hypothetical protein